MDDDDAQALGAVRLASEPFTPTPQFREELRKLYPKLKWGWRNYGGTYGWSTEPNPYDQNNMRDDYINEQLRQHFEMTPEEWKQLLEEHPDIAEEIDFEGYMRWNEQHDRSPKIAPTPPEPKDDDKPIERKS